ncbi:MAG: hypothetical protein WB439_00100 [Acidobacteriaceae bacterium]
MGDAEGQGSVEQPVIFLDENHCGNKHLHAALDASGVRYEKHLDHFPRGIEDTAWIPVVAANGWVLLTSDARIRYNSLEKNAVRANRLRMFYFTRNDIAGAEMGVALSKAIPKMIALCHVQRPPFAASISRGGDVTLRNIFE